MSPAREGSPTPVVKPAGKLREPTAAEAEAMTTAREAQALRPARASLSYEAEETAGVRKATIKNPHTDIGGWLAAVNETFGTTSDAFVHQAFGQLGTAVASKSQPLNEEQVNAAIALLSAIAPRDELEAAMGIQIAASHAASLDFLDRARRNAGEYRDTAVAYVNASTKLTRTMGALVETLAKLRAGGKQTHEVRHIHINGQAFLGDGAQGVLAAGGGGGGDAKRGQSHGPTVLAGPEVAPSLPMPRQDPARDAVPVASGEGA